METLTYNELGLLIIAGFFFIALIATRYMRFENVAKYLCLSIFAMLVVYYGWDTMATTILAFVFTFVILYPILLLIGGVDMKSKYL